MLSPFEKRFSIRLESVMNTRVDGSILGIRGQAGCFGHGITDGSLSFSKGRINRGLVSQDEWLNELVVKQQGPISLRRIHQPQEENAFGEIVKGNPEEEDVREKLEEGEESVGDPICQPFSVVVFLFAFDRLDRGVSGINEADEVAEESGAVADDQVKGGQRDQPQDNE